MQSFLASLILVASFVSADVGFDLYAQRVAPWPDKVNCALPADQGGSIDLYSLDLFNFANRFGVVSSKAPGNNLYGSYHAYPKPGDNPLWARSLQMDFEYFDTGSGPGISLTRIWSNFPFTHVSHTRHKER